MLLLVYKVVHDIDEMPKKRTKITSPSAAIVRIHTSRVASLLPFVPTVRPFGRTRKHPPL